MSERLRVLVLVSYLTCRWMCMSICVIKISVCLSQIWLCALCAWIIFSCWLFFLLCVMSMYCYVVLLQTLMILGYDSFDCFCSSFCLLFWRNLNLHAEVDLLVVGWHLFLCHNLLVFCRQVMILAVCRCAFSILGVTFVMLVEGEFRVIIECQMHS